MPQHSRLKVKRSDPYKLRKFAINNQVLHSSSEPSTPSSNSSNQPTSSHSLGQPPQSTMPHATHPTLETIPASPAPDDNYSPWSPPQFSTQFQLRRHFRLFTDEQNVRRANRGETPFCSPDGRDRAFEKLMRLNRGEEPIRWEIDSRLDSYGVGDKDQYGTVDDGGLAGEADWYKAFMGKEEEKEDAKEEDKFMDAEEVDEDTDMVDASEVSVGEGKDEGRQARRDSAQASHVAVSGGHGWKRLVGHVGLRGAEHVKIDIEMRNERRDTSDMDAECVEHVGKR